MFAGGDIVTGGATVILAMGAGRTAAKGIATYLQTKKQWPVTKEDVIGLRRSKAGAKLARATGHGRRDRARSAPSATGPSRATRSTSAAPGATLQWRCATAAR